MELPLTRMWNGKPLSVMLLVDKRLVKAKIENPDGGEPLTDMLLTLPSGKDRTGGFLHAFYVNPRKDKTSDQAQAKGLGKEMLCAVIMELVSRGELLPSDILELEASGGDCSQEDRDKITKSDEEIKAYLAKYEGLFENMIEYNREVEGRDELTREDLVETYCNFLENRKLVNYYKTFGFAEIPGEDRGNVVGMKGAVSGILSACGSKGGRKHRAYSGEYTRRRGRGVRAQMKKSRHTRGTRR